MHQTIFSVANFYWKNLTLVVTLSPHLYHFICVILITLGCIFKTTIISDYINKNPFSVILLLLKIGPIRAHDNILLVFNVYEI